MSDFFDRLESELRGAVPRAAAGADGVPRRGRARSTAGGLLVGLGSVAAIAVVVLAIAVIGNRGRANTNRGRGHTAAARGASGTACTRQPVSQLAVLRRPQTALDRAFDPNRVKITGVSNSGTFPYAVVPALTRLARTLPGGERVYFVVYRPTETSIPFPDAPTGIRAPAVPQSVPVPQEDLLEVYATRPGAHTAAFVTEVLPGALAYEDRQPPLRIANVLLSLMPDGVATVKWTYPRLVVPTVTAPGGHVYRGRVIAGVELTASVQGNVAAAQVPPRSDVFLPSVTRWLAADGRVIKTYRFPVTKFPKTIPSSGTVTSTGKMVGVPIKTDC
jgi:hypothetical protein